METKSALLQSSLNDKDKTMTHVFKGGPFDGRSVTFPSAQLDEPKHVMLSIPRGVGLDDGLAWGKISFFNEMMDRRSSASAAVYTPVWDTKTGEKTGQWVLVPAR
jgi:hypothetical protein